MDRRNLGKMAFGSVGVLALAACGQTLANVTTEAESITATVVTNVEELTNKFAIVKGIGQVALAALTVSNPAAASAITAGINLVDGWIAEGSASIAANASQVITTTDTILATAAPAITAVANQVSGAVAPAGSTAQ